MSMDNLKFALKVDRMRQSIGRKLSQHWSSINANSTFEEMDASIPTLVTRDDIDIPDGYFLVRFFDIDGTLLKAEKVAMGSDATPPANPDYDPVYLTFDKWNQSYTNIQQDRDIGATYYTKTGDSYMFVTFDSVTGLNPTIKTNKSITVDWGDGSTPTSGTTNSHTYSQAGSYVITISADSAFTYSCSTSAYLLGSQILTAALKKFYVGSIQTALGSYSCSYATRLTVVSVPNTITTCSSGVFYYCASLPIVIIPHDMLLTTSASNFCYGCTQLKIVCFNDKDTDLGQYFFQNCQQLNLVLPQKLKSFGQYAFRYANAPKKINFLGVTINNSAFSDCYSLEEAYNVSTTYSFLGSVSALRVLTYNPASNIAYLSLGLSSCSLQEITIPQNVTSISGRFQSLYSLKNIFIECNTVPTLSTSDAFNSVAAAIIWVNDTIYDQFIVATNWSQYANRIRKLSEYTGE